MSRYLLAGAGAGLGLGSVIYLLARKAYQDRILGIFPQSTWELWRYGTLDAWAKTIVAEHPLETLIAMTLAGAIAGVAAKRMNALDE